MQSGSQSNILGLEICAPLMNIRHRTHSIRSYPIQVLQKGFGINFGVRTPTPGAEASNFWTGHRDGMGLLCQNEVGSQRGMAGFRSGGPVWHSTFPNKNAGSGYDWMRLVRECCCRLFFSQVGPLAWSGETMHANSLPRFVRRQIYWRIPPVHQAWIKDLPPNFAVEIGKSLN